MSDANPVGGAAFASSRGSRSSVELHCSVSVAQASFLSPPTPKLASSTLESLIDKLGSPGGNPPPSPSQGVATSSRHRIITFSPSSLHRKETTEAPHNHSITPSPLRPDSTQRQKQQPAAVTPHAPLVSQSPPPSSLHPDRPTPTQPPSGMEQEACCTCATLLSAAPRSRFPFPPTAEQAEKAPLFDPDPEETEKPPLPNPNHDEKTKKPSLRKHQDDRRLPCCSRVICHACLVQNHRYHSYCPYCQVSSSSDPPPSYPHHDPPPYSPLPQQQPATDVSMAPSDPEKAGGGGGGLLDVGGEVEDTLHFLDHANDSVASLSLRYGVPVGVLVSAELLPVWLGHLLCISPSYDDGGGYHLPDVRAPGVLSVSVFSGKVRDWTAHLFSPFHRPPLAHPPLVSTTTKPLVQS